MNDPMQRAPAGRGRGSQDQRAAEYHHDTAPSLFDAGTDEGRRRRDDGVTIARAATFTGWRLVVDRVIRELAAEGGEFTAEDVRARAGDPLGSSPNALGAAIGAAARAGVIEQTGYQQATRPEAHARVLRVWRGVVR